MAYLKFVADGHDPALWGKGGEGELGPSEDNPQLLEAIAEHCDVYRARGFADEQITEIIGPRPITEEESNGRSGRW